MLFSVPYRRGGEAATWRRPQAGGLGSHPCMCMWVASTLFYVDSFGWTHVDSFYFGWTQACPTLRLLSACHWLSSGHLPICL